MTFVPADNVAHVAIRTVRGSEFEIINDLYVWRDDTDPIADNLTDLAVSVGGWWEDNMAALQVDAYTMVEVVCTDLTAEAGDQVTGVFSLTGTRAGDPSPGMAAVYVQFKGGSGLPRHGANYFSGSADGDSDSDVWTTLYVNDVASGYGQFQANLNADFGGHLHHCILSRYSGFTIAARANGTRYKKPTPRVT